MFNLCLNKSIKFLCQPPLCLQLKKKRIEVEILLFNCNYYFKNFIKCNFNKSVNFNLQYYSNVVPTDSIGLYFTALVEFFFSPWENLACNVPDIYPK